MTLLKRKESSSAAAAAVVVQLVTGDPSHRSLASRERGGRCCQSSRSAVMVDVVDVVNLVGGQL